MSFDLYSEINLAANMEDEFYTSQNDSDLEFLELARSQSREERYLHGEPKPVQEIFDFFKQSGELKMGTIPLPELHRDDQINMEVDLSETVSQQPIETQSVSSAHEPLQKLPKDVNTYYKNFLVILSGWIRNYFVGLVDKKQMSPEIYEKFEDVVSSEVAEETEASEPKTIHRAPRKRKIYINLKKFSTLFNDEVMKPHLSNFLNSYFLRYLMTSKTKNKSCLLRFLPVLKQGLIEGVITRLR